MFGKYIFVLSWKIRNSAWQSSRGLMPLLQAYIHVSIFFFFDFYQFTGQNQISDVQFSHCHEDFYGYHLEDSGLGYRFKNATIFRQCSVGLARNACLDCFIYANEIS